MLNLWLVALGSIAAIGNATLCVVAWNRLQSTMMPLWLVALLAHALKLACVIVPIVVATCLWLDVVQLALAFQFYTVFCLLIAVLGIPCATYRRWRIRQVVKPPRIERRMESFETAKEESRSSASWFVRRLIDCPGNQTFELEVNEKEIQLPRLSPELDGLSIAHVSDLHFTGYVGKSYFDKAIDLINDMSADLIAITGDIVDHPACLSWIPATLGRLRARHGVYVILGNHDCKQNLPNLRLVLAEAGLTNLGGRLKQISIHGVPVVLAGNELPWIAPAPDMSLSLSRAEREHVRILLAHTPDQIDWARRFDFDLMLAGHTHGGQFCLPWFGPVVCPSRLPLAYAAGTLHEPPTHLHVSRGLSAWVPVRWNCRPEITKLQLRWPLGPRQTPTDEAHVSSVDEATLAVPVPAR